MRVKIYKSEEERITVFFSKNERKTHSTRVILTVGALAAVGAISIFKCGKQMAGDVLCKVKAFLKSEKPECHQNMNME